MGINEPKVNKKQWGSRTLWILSGLNILFFLLIVVDLFQENHERSEAFRGMEIRANLVKLLNKSEFNQMFQYASCHEWVDLTSAQGERLLSQLQGFGWFPSQSLYEKREMSFKVAIASPYAVHSLAYQKWLDSTAKRVRESGFMVSPLLDTDYPSGGLLIKNFDRESDAQSFLALPEIRKIAGAKLYQSSQDNLYQRIVVTVGAGFSRDNFAQTLSLMNIESPQDCRSDIEHSSSSATSTASAGVSSSI